jgi:hypothetical protein
MKFILFYLIIATLLIGNLFSQKEYNNWYFGIFAGVTFNTPDGEPVAVLDGKTYNRGQISKLLTCPYGVSAISDIKGNLLFYFDGIDVYNKRHEIMKNGDQMMGHGKQADHYTGTQSGMIVPFKFSDSLFLLFAMSQIDLKGYFSIIDMSKENGFGEVIVKDSLLNTMNTWVGEQITTTRHKNGKDWWVIFRQSKKINYFKEIVYYSYLVTEKGVSTNPVVSKLGTNGTMGDGGELKFSPDGKKIAQGYYDETMLYDFDNNTGVISNRINLGVSAWGVEFSPDGSKLYTSGYMQSVTSVQNLYQFDLNNKTEKEIQKSRIKLDSGKLFIDNFYTSHSIQLAPNGKLYISQHSGFCDDDYNDTNCLHYHLGVINKPNLKGNNCDFNMRGVYLGGKGHFNGFGLPNGISSYFNVDVTASNNSPVCPGDTLFLFADSKDSVTYEWTGPNGFTSNLRNPIIPNASPDMTGEYKVTVTLHNLNGTATTNVLVNIPPKPKIIGSTEICIGDSSLLKSAKKYINYLWSTGEITDNITVSKIGQYWLEVIDTNGCRGRDTINISNYPNPAFQIAGITTICEGDSTILAESTNNINFKYLWSTGETSYKITVKTSGKYKLIVTDKLGCRDSAEVEVKVIPFLNAQINGNPILCKGSSNVLTAEPIGSGFKYLWSTGDTSQSINIDKPGRYWVKVTLNDNCTDSAFIDVKEVPIPQFSITGDSLFCPGRTSILLVQNDYQSYLWSTGDTTKSISVNTPDIYSVTVTDTNGCSGTELFEVKLYDIKLTGLTDLNFGSRQAGGSYPLNLTLKNESNAPIQIKSITTKNLSSIFNITTNPSLSAPLDVGSSIDVIVTFKPDLNQSYSDSLIVVIDSPCPDTLSSYLTGTSKALTTIFIPDLTATVGTPDFCIPLMAKKDANMQIIDNLSFTAEIRYDATALIPNENFPIESGDRVITLSGNNIKFINNEIELGNFCGDVVLANKDVTPLRITQFKWNNANIDTILQNGSLTIMGLCQRSIARIQIFNPVEFSINQTIVSSELEISTKNTTNDDILTIYSIIGIEMGSYFCSEQMNIDISGLGSGVYFVRIGEKVGKFVKM